MPIQLSNKWLWRRLILRMNSKPQPHSFLFLVGCGSAFQFLPVLSTNRQLNHTRYFTGANYTKVSLRHSRVTDKCRFKNLISGCGDIDICVSPDGIVSELWRCISNPPAPPTGFLTSNQMRNFYSQIIPKFRSLRAGCVTIF